LKLRFVLWLLKTKEQTSHKTDRADEFRRAKLVSRVLHKWRLKLLIRQRRTTKAKHISDFKDRHKLKKGLAAWKSVCLQQKKLREFVVLRYKRRLRACLTGLQMAKEADLVKGELEAQAEWLRAKTLMERTVSRWRSAIAQEQDLRKLQLTWNYWRRVFISDVKARVDIERRVIRRHLICYYWGRLRRAVKAAKADQIARLNYKCMVFAAWKSAAGTSQAERLKQQKAKEFYRETLRTRGVMCRQGQAIIRVLLKNVDSRIHRRQGLALADSFAMRRLVLKVVPQCFQAWRALKLAGLVDAHRRAKLLEKAFEYLQQLAAVSREKYRLACLSCSLKAYRKAFSGWKSVSVIRRAPYKAALKHRISALLTTTYGRWKAEVFAVDVGQVAQAMDFYDKNLLHRSMISWRLGLMHLTRQKAKTSQAKWFRFNKDVQLLKRVVKAWKILHRVKFMLRLYVVETQSCYFYRWRRVVRFQGLLKLQRS
jgi:tetratricopeptide (TPR) repeat protein